MSESMSSFRGHLGFGRKDALLLPIDDYVSNINANKRPKFDKYGTKYFVHGLC
jgi:hypothetical protein